MNIVIIKGNLTRDPELRFSPKGTAVAQIGVALNRKWKDANGEAKEEVTFVDVTAWGKQAETFAQYHKKGQQTLIHGRLKTETWDDKKTGEKRYKLGVVMESFEFVGSSKNADSGSRETAPAASAAPTTSTPPEDDDVPF